MNKISTTALLLIAIALVYFFRDKLRRLITPPAVINITPAATKCDCPSHTPAAPVPPAPAAEEEETADDDLLEVMMPTNGNYSTGAFAYSLNANTIY
jgi:hypothetical protein